MRHRPVLPAVLLLGLITAPALAVTTYRVNIHGLYDVTQGTPLSHSATGPIAASNGTASLTGSGFAYPGHVGSFAHADMTWSSGFSGGCSASTFSSNRTEDFVISGPAGPPVAGTLHFRAKGGLSRVGGFAGNGGHATRVSVRVSVNGTVATGEYFTSNGGSSSAGVLSGLTGDTFDRSFDVSGNFPVGTPFAVELKVQDDVYCYGNVFNTNPGFSEVNAGHGAPGGGGLQIVEVSGAVMALPPGYTLDSGSWGIANNHYSSGVAVEPSPPPGDFSLAIGPNPSVAVVTLRFAQPRAGAVAVDVFDANGRHVRNVANGWMPAGESVAAWDGRDAGGTRVSPGLYYARFVATGHTVTRRIVRVE